MAIRFQLAAVTLLTILLAGPASAGELCVICTGPDASYRCQVEGIARSASTGTQAQLLCIAELAKSGGHEICGVARRPSGPCDGVLTVVRPELAGDEGLAGLSGAGVEEPSDRSGRAPGPDAAAPPPEPEPPPTVAAELKKAGKAAGETAEKAGENLKGAGSAVGSAAQKTWDCVTSLFGDC